MMKMTFGLSGVLLPVPAQEATKNKSEIKSTCFKINILHNRFIVKFILAF
jgi:hypothetical protein